MNTSDFNFYHSGDLGDIIYSLPTIKALGGGNLYLGPNHRVGQPPEKEITQRVVDNLQPILNDQPYLKLVKFNDNHTVGINYNLNQFRLPFVDWNQGRCTVEEAETIKHTNLVKLYQLEFNIPGELYLTKWLTCNESISYTNYPIVVNRTFRYRNPDFPWCDIVDTFRDKIIFLGLPAEYEDFCNKFGDIKYVETPEFYTAYKIINGCKLFIGSQSFLYSLAEGLKKPCLQESSYYMQTNLCFRKDAYFTNTTTKCQFNHIKPFITKYLFE